MSYDGIAKVQHYVPQFILRNFTLGKKEQLFVFDKQADKIFKTKSKNILCESRLYDFVLNDSETNKNYDVTLEHSLSEIEGNAQEVFSKILIDNSLQKLTAEDKVMLSIFFSVQLTRTRHYIDEWARLPIILKEELERRFPCESLPVNMQEYFSLRDENELKRETALNITKAPDTYAIHFLSKHWVLLETTFSVPFIIGDNPLTMCNSTSSGLFGGSGLATPGTEIYFPISATKALGMLCTTITEEINKGVNKLKKHEKYEKLLPKFLRSNLKVPLDIQCLYDAINTGSPFMYKPEEVKRFNALQVSNAERYLLSPIDDFNMAKKMIKEYPYLKFGPRIEVAKPEDIAEEIKKR